MQSNIDNFTKAQIAYLWLNYQYYNIEKSLHTHAYQAISQVLWDRLTDIWNKLYYCEQQEIVELMKTFDAIKSICISLHDSAADDKWLATIKI